MKTKNVKLHIGLHVSDVVKSTKFYQDLFNQKPVKVKDNYAKFETEQVVLSMIYHPSKAKSGFGHMGLRFDNSETVKEHFERLTNLNYTIRKEGVVECCHSIQDKFWIADPDGHDWEMYTFIEDVENDALPKLEIAENENACCGPTCCN